MGLDEWEHYWTVARGLGRGRATQRQRQIRHNAGIRSGYGSQGDPLGAQTPMVQNRMLGYLAQMAAGRIDDWESLIDPTLTYDENKAILLENGAQKLPGDREREQRQKVADAEDRARRYARQELFALCDSLQENVDDPADYLLYAHVDEAEPTPGVDAEEITQTVHGMGREFGDDFVQDAIERCRARMEMYEKEPEPFLERNEAGEVVLDPEQIANDMIEALQA